MKKNWRRPYWKTVGQAFGATLGHRAPLLWFLLAAVAAVGSRLTPLSGLDEFVPYLSDILVSVSGFAMIVYLTTLTRVFRNLPRPLRLSVVVIAAVVVVHEGLFWTSSPIDSPTAAVLGFVRTWVSIQILFCLVAFELSRGPGLVVRILDAVLKNLAWVVVLMLAVGAMITLPAMLLTLINPPPFAALRFNSAVVVPLVRTVAIVLFWALMVRAFSPTLRYFDHVSPDFRRLSARLDDELAVLNGDRDGFYRGHNTLDAIEHVVVAYDGRTAVGCGAVKWLDGETWELKRMFVLPDYRRQGIAEDIVCALETVARSRGVRRLVLETGASFQAPIALYGKLGYSVIENYGQYRGVATSVCMAKSLEE